MLISYANMRENMPRWKKIYAEFWDCHRARFPEPNPKHRKCTSDATLRSRFFGDGSALWFLLGFTDKGYYEKCLHLKTSWKFASLLLEIKTKKNGVFCQMTGNVLWNQPEPFSIRIFCSWNLKTRGGIFSCIQILVKTVIYSFWTSLLGSHFGWKNIFLRTK